MATVSDEEIRNYFAAIPATTSDEEIMSVMEQFDVSPNDIGRALNATPEVTEQFAQRYREAGGTESRQFGTEGVLGRDVVAATQAFEGQLTGTPSDLQYVQEIDRLGLTPEQYAQAINQPSMAAEFRQRYDVAKAQLPSYDVPALDFSNIELTGDPEQDREILANAIMSGAVTLAQQPYEAYPEERVVPFTEEELTGRERTREIAASGVGTPEVERALEVARDVAGYTPGLLRDVDLTPYQTQYQEGVTDIALRELDRQRQMRQQDIAQQAIQAGAFGGARQGVVESELERTYAQQAGDIAARIKARTAEC